MQSLKLDLAKLTGAKPFTAKDGITQFIAIPLQENHVFVGKNGAHYLEIMLFENRDGPGKWGDDGYASISIPKEARAAGEKAPIVGNWKHVGKGRDVPASEATRKHQQAKQDGYQPQDDPNDENLPF